MGQLQTTRVTAIGDVANSKCPLLITAKVQLLLQGTMEDSRTGVGECNTPHVISAGTFDQQF